MGKFLLKQKMGLTLLMGTIAATFLVGIVSNYYLTDLLVAKKQEDIFYNSVEKSYIVEKDFDNSKLFVQTLNNTLPISKYIKERNIEDKEVILDLFNTYTQEKKYLALYILDKKGDTLLSSDKDFLNNNYSFRSYFKEAMSGKFNVDFALGTTSGEFGYYFADPIFDENNTIIGVLVLKLNKDQIESSIFKNQILSNSNVMIVSEYGIILGSTEKLNNFKTLGAISDKTKERIKQEKKIGNRNIEALEYNQAQENILNYTKDTNFKFYDKDDGEEEIMSVLKIARYPYFLVTETKLDLLQTSIFTVSVGNLLVLFTILTILSLFIYVVFYKFLIPINTFILFFKKISEGNFSERLSISTNDEFEELAESINDMTKELSDLYKNLDEKVQQQTEQIALQFTELQKQNKKTTKALKEVELEKNNALNLTKDLEKFKLALDNVSDQIVITDSEGIVLYGNNAMEKITGYSKEEAIGKKAGTLWNIPMSQPYYQKLWNTIKIDKKTFLSEIKNRRKNGEIYDALISISLVLDKKGKILFFVAIERDITKEKEVSKAKTEFVSLASHQLRTPLSSINWYTEILLSEDFGKINKEQKEYLHEIKVGEKRIMNLINDFLNISKLDMGIFELDIEKVNIVDLLSEVISELKSDIFDKKLELIQDIDDTLISFLSDKKFMRIIFQNLISNSIKYSEKESKIYLNLKKVTKGDVFGSKKINEDSLLFSVQDLGVGIPKEEEDKIFSKLFRASNVRKLDVEGTGLGLYFIKSIIEKSNGNIWFESQHNKGTTFYVIFPIKGMKNINIA